MKPKIINGNCHIDIRGKLNFNNDFNLSEIKRVYTIENSSTEFRRGWQGHKIEQRWFTAIEGRFEIKIIIIDNWENPDFKLEPFVFELNSEKFDVLHIPSGCISCIQALEINSKLLVFADYFLGEIEDEYRFSLEYFNT